MKKKKKKNSQPQTKFTGSYKKKECKLKGFFYFCYIFTSQISNFLKQYVVIKKTKTDLHQCLL